MSRLSVPKFREPAAPSPPVVEAPPTVTLTKAELEEELAKAHDAGFEKGVREGEERVRGLEKAELENLAESVDERQRLVEKGVSDAEKMLRDLAARCEKYNDSLDDCLEEAAGSMAAQLLIEVNRAEALIADLVMSLKERHRVTAITVSVAPSLSDALAKALDDEDGIVVEASENGQTLLIRLETDAGPLRYSLKEVAEELHRRLLAKDRLND